MKNKYIAFFLCLMLLMTSLPSTMGAEKKNEKGEVLNFAPFVDFELKEQEKIDVIVDVGNTALTMDEANSYVNQTLRPMLQSSGKDFKLHVEKSNEGATKLYYFERTTGPNGEQSALYYYDITTKNKQFVRYVQSHPTNTVKASVYDPNSQLIFAMSVYPMFVVSTNPNETFANNGALYVNNGYSGSAVDITTDGYVMFNGSSISAGSDYYTHALKIDDVIAVKNTSNPIPDSRGRRSSENMLTYFKAGKDDTLINNHNGAIWSSKHYLDYYTSSIPRNPADIRLGNVSHTGSTASAHFYGYSKETGEILIVRETTRPNGQVQKYDTMIYDPKTGNTRIFEEGTSGTGARIPQIIFMDGKGLIFKSNNDGLIYHYEDYTDPTTKTLLGDKIDLNILQANMRTSPPINYIGNSVIYGGHGHNTPGYSLLIGNLDTGTMEEISHFSNAPSVVSFPSWYEAKKRYITDIIEEIPYRADADKYYIRLDDHHLTQIENPSQLGKTAATFAEQGITFLSLGSSVNDQSINNLISTINDNGMFINTGNRSADFAKATEFIEQYKKAHVLIVQGDQSYSTSQLELMAGQIGRTLKQHNIGVQIKSIQDTTTNLFELLNGQSWYNDVNQYVLYIHRGNVVPLSDEEIMANVATLLRGNYAFVIGNSSATNQAPFNALIEINDEQGMVTSSASYTTVATEAAQYILQTAIPNPKRVSDTLVLQRDPITGEYASEVIVTTHYEDFENDRKRNERFKTTHDPTVYENHSGVMEGIGQYHESPTTRFTKVGRYEMVVQVQDEPIEDNRFNEYWHWSKDSLSQLVLYVHRAPVAEFTTTVNSARRLTITDHSYDLDRYTQHNKGLTTWEWKWKRIQDTTWTPGNPPMNLQANTDYFISLKVKDIDHAWSTETIKIVTTSPYNQPPVALFTVDPATVSHNKSATITDLSYDPDGDVIVAREWKVYRDKQLLLESSTKPTIASIKQAAQSNGLQILGQYRIELRVQDQPGLWSETYRDMLEVINLAPIADFEPIEHTYRDTINTIINTTAAPDLDGDHVSYNWTLLYNDQRYGLGTARNASFKIEDRGLEKKAVGTWMLELKASDPLGAHSFMTHSFDVLNQIPTTTITSGNSTGYINQPYAYTSSRHDADTEDNNNLQSFWKLTTPSGKTKSWTTKDITITYDEKGLHTLENWVVDPLDAKSEIDQMEVMIENLIPVPGFMVNPNPTYRGIDVSFTSTATDLDGYIDNHFYYVKTPGSTSKTYLGSLADFIRSFSSVGDLTIEQVVVDNDGAEARLEKTLTILNRQPTAIVTVPSGTNSANATQFNTLTPTIEWTMQDADGDSQQRYQVQIKQSNGTVLYTSNQVTSSNKTFDIPASVGLQENITYRATVRVFDGFDWSEYATDKYFYIVLNQPPVAGFTWEPSSIWEGDHVVIKHQVSDPDNDTLIIRYELTSPNGQKSYYPSSSSFYQVPGSQYSSNAFSIANAQPGRYSITQTVTDGKSNPVSQSNSFNVSELTVLGNVQHTDEWEQHRINYNAKNPGAQRDQLTFWAGERFVLSADTTNTGSSMTKATKVDVVARRIGSTTLASNNTIGWEGYIGSENADVKLQNLADGDYEFTFRATYSNGTVKEDVVIVTIKGNWTDFYKLHQSW